MTVIDAESSELEVFPTALCVKCNERPRRPKTSPKGKAPVLCAVCSGYDEDGEPEIDPSSPFAPDGDSDEIAPAPALGAAGTASVAGSPPPGDASGPRRRGIFARFRKGATGSPAPALPGRERAPKRPVAYKGKRISASETIGDVWTMAGGYLQKAGHAPTGRMLAFQAPMAGELLDEMLKGTTVDKIVVQRIVGARGKFDGLAGVLAPPILTMQMERAAARGDQAAFEQLGSVLRMQLKRSLPQMLPAIKKIRAREAQETKAFTELLDPEMIEALGLTVIDGRAYADGHPVDVGDVLISMLFGDFIPAATELDPTEGTEDERRDDNPGA